MSTIQSTCQNTPTVLFSPICVGFKLLWDKTFQHILLLRSLVLLGSMVKCTSSDVIAVTVQVMLLFDALMMKAAICKVARYNLPLLCRFTKAAMTGFHQASVDPFLACSAHFCIKTLYH